MTNFEIFSENVLFSVILMTVKLLIIYFKILSYLDILDFEVFKSEKEYILV